MRQTDPEHAVPKYIRIKEDIIKAIREGRLQAEDQVMSRSQFVEAYGVSDITVRKAIDELTSEGYLYRIHGKGTYVASRQRPLTVALLMPHLHMPKDTEYSVGYNTAPPLIQAIEDEAKLHGANLMLYLAGDRADVERDNLAGIVTRKVDAAVIWHSGDDGNIERLQAVRDAGIPFVLVDRYIPEFETDYVATDHFTGAYDAVRTLIDAGFTNIHHMTCCEPLTSVSERIRGYRQAMEDGGLTPQVQQVPFVLLPSMEATSCRATTALLRETPTPFAIFASNAVILEGAWRAIEEAGIPRDRFALACFDEPYTRLPQDVRFVRVAQPLEEIGRRCVRILVDKINGIGALRQEVVRPGIIVSGMA